MSAEELYQKLKESSKCKSLLKKYLTPEVLTKLKEKKTKQGGTFADVIRGGCHTLHTGTGIRVCDADAYSVFADLLHPIILEYHNLTAINHPQLHLGDINSLHVSNLDEDYVISTRVRTGRSIEGHSFYPVMAPKVRAAVEDIIVAALSTLKGELEGEYHPLSSLSATEINNLIADHYLFSQNERIQKSCGQSDDWPNNRGIFFNKSKTLIVWVNEEDHMRIISMDKGGNLGEVYARFVTAVQALSQKLSFARRDDLGFVNTCPSNLGTGLRASVNVKIPRLSKKDDFLDILAHYHLEARGTDGYGTESVDGVYDISNKRRLGLTEIEAVNEMATGIQEIIAREKTLEKPNTQ